MQNLGIFVIVTICNTNSNEFICYYNKTQLEKSITFSVHGNERQMEQPCLTMQQHSEEQSLVPTNSTNYCLK